MDRPLDGKDLVYYAAASVARINALVIARLRGPLDPSLLRPALDAVQARHALLGVHIELRGGHPRFVSAGTPPIPLRVDPRRGPEHWRAEADRGLDERFDLARGPPMRCVLLHGGAGPDAVHDLLLPFHHLVGDGMGAVTVVRDLLQAHADLAAGKAPGLGPLPDPPPMRDLSPLPVRGLRGRLMVLGEVLHVVGLLARHKPRVLRWDARVPRAQRRTRLLHFQLPGGVAAGLAARAKAESTTVTGALAAAFLRALAEDVGGEAPAVMCSIPANLRPHLPGIDPELFGYYSWGFGTIQRFGPGRRFWDVARAVRDDMERERARGGLWRGLAILEWQGPRTLRQGPEKLLASLDRSGANSVSNVGRVEVPERFGPLAWEDLHFSGSADGAGAGVGLVAVTFRGRMTLNFAHPVPLVSEPRGDRVARRTLELLQEAVAGDPAVPPATPGPAGEGSPGTVGS